MVPILQNEAERLAALRELRILGTAPEPHFDAVCRTTSALFSAPIALVALVEESHQWFKAKCGLAAEGTSREAAFCSHTILSDDVLVVEDARQDPTFRSQPARDGRAPYSLLRRRAVGPAAGSTRRDFVHHRHEATDVLATTAASTAGSGRDRRRSPPAARSEHGKD